MKTPRVMIVKTGGGKTVIVANGAFSTVVVDGFADDVTTVVSVMVVLEIGVDVVVSVVVGTMDTVDCGPTLREN